MSRRYTKSPLIGLALAGLTALPAGANPSDTNKNSRWFQTIDQDANGAISLQEFLQKRGEQFVKLDANKNGAVSIEEHTKAKTSVRRFLDLDLNGDSVIKYQEFLTPSRTRFNRLDNNNDGKIVQSEIDIFRTRMRAKHEQRKRHAQNTPPSAFRLTKLARLNYE